jgi:hypothetical protein
LARSPKLRYVLLRAIRLCGASPVAQATLRSRPRAFRTSQWLDQLDTPGQLERWQVSLDELEIEATENLAAALNNATMQHKDIDGVRLGYLESTLPFKTALLLAPNLKEVVAPLLGWPLYAAMPDRDCVFSGIAGTQTLSAASATRWSMSLATLLAARAPEDNRSTFRCKPPRCGFTQTGACSGDND